MGSHLTKWWHVSWKRVVVTLAVIFGGLWLLVGAVELVLVQLAPWNLARSTRLENPQTSEIPIALPDLSIALLKGTRVVAYGFSVDTPWQKIDRQRAFNTVSLWNFADGANLLIMNEANLPGLAGSFGRDQRAVRLFGRDTLRSESALLTAEMYSTPEQVKWWKLPSQNARAGVLVGLKETHCREYGTIYAINFGRMHGFQEGAPDAAPYKVELNLFDPNDRRYEIEITGEAGKPLPLTQAQLNSMVASIRPSPSQ